MKSERMRVQAIVCYIWQTSVSKC